MDAQVVQNDILFSKVIGDISANQNYLFISNNKNYDIV